MRIGFKNFSNSHRHVFVEHKRQKIVHKHNAFTILKVRYFCSNTALLVDTPEILPLYTILRYEKRTT